MPKTREQLIEMMETLADEALVAKDFSAAIRAVQLAGLNHGIFVAKSLFQPDEHEKSDEELEAAVRAMYGGLNAQ